MAASSHMGSTLICFSVPRFSHVESTVSSGIKRQSLLQKGIWMAEPWPVWAGPNCGAGGGQISFIIGKLEAQKGQVLGGLSIDSEAVGKL